MAFPVSNIRHFCSLKNTNIKQLEIKLGIGNGVISKWEHSKRSPPYEKLLAIANELGVTVEELTYGEKEICQPAAKEADPTKKQLYEMIDRLSAGQLLLLLEKAQEIEKI